MFEHPYLSRQVTAFEQERIARDAERRRFLIEHADQLVPRSEGALRRMLRRLVGGGRRVAPPSRSTSPGTAPERVMSGCERAAAPAQ